MKAMHKRHLQDDAVVYLVGGGIASLAAAAFLIRDGNIKGHNINILEESARIGGSLDAAGSFVKKPMSACNGREIMTEIMGHLHIEADASKILENCICIPCMMPFITSQFLCRNRGDRPQVVPDRSKNLAYIGQFCELSDDVVFTVEYSIRCAQTAVYSLLGLNRRPPPVYKGQYNPRVLLKTFLTLHGQKRVNV